MTLLQFDNLTVTQFIREIKFWQIETVQKCHFWPFQRFSILILANISNFQVPNLLKFKVQSLYNGQKWHFWTVSIGQNSISRKIWVLVNDQISTKSSLNFTFWKFLEHSVCKAFLRLLESAFANGQVFHFELIRLQELYCAEIGKK